MKIESKKDMRLVSRARREGWPVDRELVSEALHEVIRNRDPDLMMDAIELLLKADGVNVKREAVQQRELSGNDDRRLQLLELAQRIPAPELARIASANGISLEGGAEEGRADESAGVDGEEAGG